MRPLPLLAHQSLGLLGRGAMGEVQRLWDHDLERTLAGKYAVQADSDLETRLIHEARVTARLNHPGVVPVHQLGRLPDGRLCFTMEEVEGQTLTERIVAAHRDGLSPRALRHLIEAVRRVCETVAYAHERGIVHLDLKPDNVMLGRFGEVRVLDWGLARELGWALEPGAGSPAWMPPEQAWEGVARPTLDVYALGAIIYQVLAGSPPRPAHNQPLEEIGPLAPPEELARICQRAMAGSPQDRYPDASVLAEDVSGWLDGVHREERARAYLARGEALTPLVRDLRARALSLRRRAHEGLSALPRHAPVVDKSTFWSLDDEAAALDREAALTDVERNQLLQAALTEAPELEAVHQALADGYLVAALDAESRRDAQALAPLEALVRIHDRGAHEGWLRGDGLLDLRTDPAGVEVWAHPIRAVQRRLLPGPGALLGRTPLVGVSLPAGGHLIVLRGPGLAELRYPVLIPRSGRWAPVRPGDRAPFTLRLPEAAALGQGDVLVPAGPAILGDPDLQGGLPRRQIWLDSFVLRRDPVTNREYLAWLDALVAEGRGAEAERHAPRLSPNLVGQEGRPVYGRAADGRFLLVPDAEGDLWQPDWPVVLIDWDSAMAFADWTAARTGLPWRLAWEPEREKALRGVDGRTLPWGDQLEPTWSRNAQSGPWRPTPAPVGTPPEDESVYGVRGLAGNVRDWTLSLRDGSWAHVDADGLFTAPPLEQARRWEGWRLNLGGAWSSGPGLGRAGHRLAAPTDHRNALIGIRLARSMH